MKTLFFNFIEYIRLKPIMIKYECILSDDDIESLLKQSKIADNIITNEYAQWAGRRRPTLLQLPRQQRALTATRG